MAADRTRSACVVRWPGEQFAAIPRQLVLRLAVELEPTLIEDCLVQAGFGPHLLSGLLNATLSRPGHVPRLQVLDTHHRVVLTDRGLV